MREETVFCRTRVVLALVLALTIGIVAAFVAVPLAQADDIRTSIYGWGRSDAGQLGNNSPVDVYQPIRLVQLSLLHETRGITEMFIGQNANSSSLFAILADGYVYAWGNGSNGRLGNGGTADLVVPTEIPQLTALHATRGITEIHLGNAHNYAVTSDGYVYGWGNGAFGRLGTGNTDDVLVPTEIPAITALVQSGAELHFALHHSFAITSDGYVYGWGRGEHGRLGSGNAADILLPAEIPHLTALNATRGIAELLLWDPFCFAITSDGYIYGWGNGAFGRLGNGISGIVFVPAEIPALTTLFRDEGLRIYPNNMHSFGITSDGTVFVWGVGENGRLGTGNTDNVLVPTINQSITDLVQAGAELRRGNNHTFAFIPFQMPNSPLIKTLQTNEGTLLPNDPSYPTFTFNFERRQVALNDTGPPIMSNPIAGTNSVPNIANQTITVDPTTASTTGGITTVTGELNLWTLIQSALDTQGDISGGVFVWEVSEVAGSSSLHSPPQVHMTYDQSRFQIRAHVNRYGDLKAIELLRMEQVENVWQIILPKVDDGEINFTNTYTKIITPPERAILYISKEVTGEMANLTTPFNFTLTLANPELRPPAIGTITAEIVNATTGASFSPVREVTITEGANTFELRHNEKLRIPQLPAGTRFQVTEAAVPEFQPQATVAGIAVAPATGTYPQQEPNTALYLFRLI